jgi:hypothetical protein
MSKLRCEVCGKIIRKNQKFFGVAMGEHTGNYHYKCVDIVEKEGGTWITMPTTNKEREKGKKC